MAYIHSDALDALLSELKDNMNDLHICSQEPTTYEEATVTYTLGNKTGITSGAIGDRVAGGREFEVDEITDGDVTGTGNATHWAIVDTALGAERLLCAQELEDGGQHVTAGNVFTLTAITIGVPDPE